MALKRWYFTILPSILTALQAFFRFFSRWHIRSLAPRRSSPRSELPLWEFPSRLRRIPPAVPPRCCHGPPAGPRAPLWSPAWHLTARRNMGNMGKHTPWNHKDVRILVSFSVIFWILVWWFLWFLVDLVRNAYSCVRPVCLWLNNLWSSLQKCLKNQGPGTWFPHVSTDCFSHQSLHVWPSKAVRMDNQLYDVLGGGKNIRAPTPNILWVIPCHFCRTRLALGTQSIHLLNTINQSIFRYIISISYLYYLY